MEESVPYFEKLAGLAVDRGANQKIVDNGDEVL